MFQRDIRVRAPFCYWGEDPATRAWNFAVGVYYKAGGVPWRLPPTGPDTCFVGISFHHFRTTQRAIVRSSLAQAFSSDGEGFAIRGEGVPVLPDQGRNVHLSEHAAQFETATTLNPNDVWSYCPKGFFLTCSGKLDEGISCENQALRLNPLVPDDCLYTVGVANYHAGRYEEAMAAFGRMSDVPIPIQGYVAGLCALKEFCCCCTGVVTPSKLSVACQAMAEFLDAGHPGKANGRP